MREAIIHLTDGNLEAIGLGGVVRTVREAGLKDLTEVGPEGIHQIRVENPIPEAELNRLDAVEWWETIDESAAGTTYLWKLRVPAYEERCPLEEHSTAYEISEIHERRVELSIIGSQDEISRTVRGIVESGIHVNLERLTEYQGPTSPLDRLTDRQREVVQTAYALGYYAVPRAATTEDVAEEIGLEPSTVAEHLQRAERTLMGDVLVPAD